MSEGEGRHTTVESDWRAAVSAANRYGSFELVSGIWTYTLDNSAVQSLDAGQVVQDTHTFTASNGATQTVTVTITGAEDASVITGAFTGAVAEDGAGTASGALAISDVDANRSAVHTSELPSLTNVVCLLLFEPKTGI